MRFHRPATALRARDHGVHHRHVPCLLDILGWRSRVDVTFTQTWVVGRVGIPNFDIASVYNFKDSGVLVPTALKSACMADTGVLVSQPRSAVVLFHLFNTTGSCC
ncbi:unnamed protein product [Ostreobium quekettii]|uniref:Uncharacterized protein n=1 Tax=Ostreobium quekettii TaxID=121088 RepID=A0A8S1JAN4_9CHLO|nr:unnamed protein product [Ostreobium quekettii]|eukprot:evm.model.scf_1211.4 EVM.evm.TU.scf_1211.4   scf_1211:42522-42836(+)